MRSRFMVCPALPVTLASCSLVYDSAAHIDSRGPDPREGQSCTPGDSPGCGEGLFCDEIRSRCQSCFHMEGVVYPSLTSSNISIEGLFLEQGEIWVSGSTEGPSVWLGYVQDQKVRLAAASLDSSGTLASGFENVPLDSISTLGSVSSVDFCSTRHGDHLALAGDEQVEIFALPHRSDEAPRAVGVLASARISAAIFAGCVGAPASPRLLRVGDEGVQVAKITPSATGEFAGILPAGDVTYVEPASATPESWSSDGMGHVLFFGAEHDSALVTPGGSLNVAASRRFLATPVFDAGALAATSDGVLLAWDQGDHIALQPMGCDAGSGCSEGEWPAQFARTGGDIDEVRGVALTPSPDGTSTIVSVESSSIAGQSVLAIRLLDVGGRPAHIPSWGTVVRYPSYEGDALTSLGGAVAATRAVGDRLEMDSLHVAYEVLAGDAQHSVEVRSFQSCGSGGRLGGEP